MTSPLFTQGRLGSLILENRMVRSASHEGLSDARGRPTEAMAAFHCKFAKGGVGLIITGYAGVMQNGKSDLYRMTMIDDDELVAAHAALVSAVHAAGGKIVSQIAHCGRQTLSASTGEHTVVAPSAIPNKFYKEVPRQLTSREIVEIVDSFAAAATRVKQAGYDGVQVHGAHGYLLSTFLSRSANRRKDKWGGPLENRFRALGETLRAVRDAVGADFPVLLKLNGFERGSLGMNPEECVEVAKLVEKTGSCDGLEISAGSNEDAFYMARGDLPAEAIARYMRPYCKWGRMKKFFLERMVAPVMATPIFHPRFEEGYNLGAAAMVKRAVGLPVITVGGMRSKAFMESAIQSGMTDFVSMARPLIREPNLPNKFREGKSEAAKCDNCNRCFVACDTVSIRCHSGEGEVAS